MNSPRKGDFLMFTGIITNLGKLKKKNGSVFIFEADRKFCRKLGSGASVAVNGTCLTIFEKPTLTSFSVELMPETLNRTMFKHIKLNEPVNLELPLSPAAFLSGHLVQGHIDGVAQLKKFTKKGNSLILQFSLPENIGKYVAEKGSIAVNGISLTVALATKSYFTVGIIPYTWTNTMLKTIKIGNFVNIETDILAKYLEKLMKK
ncbi:MAG: Riboflavin synthase, alpha subunit [uncultured bacterium]|uniref:Riboflavin synthase n=1 Tax=Candidatus Daviesbacteria bacterium GW2011_GWC2_40_12 TaxID=1618431 RepID=A0A0G0QMV8_9BACT|nr:MAG: Riboflavin synthase, alpha subunit [uncultured bacterium]KKQ82877.1 MAG: hypothetical protein UT04_C0044G0007 [Candidatus Daviesbacteria bacterium GW2011_GWF2_38_7]KKR16005.1 MAG: hypothetical protein UT45_C0010G0019 [Candidatus Daviesbacteria bacterium GW2011_GWA2_39_33]KKR23446.1 MAG: hypothetical protein UT54_C0048G0006 [Candidatus Daviesbacteria bacterium GW2011_GWB1_39_5]KKR41493.1 MAG: hypothetical protein UT77_C0010G0019 [Candidatus Daviesbacteria bacterium GW2011_GWC2_40_12]